MNDATYTRVIGRVPFGTVIRLDHILDGLADGLNEAVVASLKEAVTEVVGRAVVAAVKEVLTNAELQKRLRPEPVSRPSVIGWAGRVLCLGLVRVVRGSRNGATPMKRLAESDVPWLQALTSAENDRFTCSIDPTRSATRLVVLLRKTLGME